MSVSLFGSDGVDLLFLSICELRTTKGACFRAHPVSGLVVLCKCPSSLVVIVLW